MRRRVEPLIAVLRVAFQADAKLAALMVLVLFLALGSTVAFAVSFKVIVDAALAGDVARGITGGVIAALSLGFSAAWLPIGGPFSLVLQERIGAAVDAELMTLSARVPTLELFERPEYLSKLSLLMNDDRHVVRTAVVTVSNGIVLVVLVVIMAVVLAAQHPALALLPLSAAPPLWLATVGGRSYHRALEETAEDDRLARGLLAIATTPAAGKELRVFGLLEPLIGRYDAAPAAVTRRMTRVQWRGNLQRALGWLVFTVAYTAAVLLVAGQAASGRATAGDVVLVVSLAIPIVFLSQFISDTLGHLTRLVGTAERYRWLRDVTTPPPRGGHTDVPPRLREGVRLEQVSFRYPGGQADALEAVDLHLPAGAVVALVGDNGAGKTTLVKLLTGMYRPTAGRISVDGADLATLDIEAWRGRISAGFQDFCQFEVLSREAVGVGDLPRIDDLAAVSVAAGRAGADGVAEQLPNGWETQLGRGWDGGVDLSTGQWQKLALARALMRDDPLLIVLDEPTAALDPSAEHALFENFAAAARAGRADGAITLLVSHRFSTVRMADLIVVIDGGRVVEMGSHSELVAAGGLYGELFELQARSYR